MLQFNALILPCLVLLCVLPALWGLWWGHRLRWSDKKANNGCLCYWFWVVHNLWLFAEGEGVCVMENPIIRELNHLCWCWRRLVVCNIVLQTRNVGWWFFFLHLPGTGQGLTLQSALDMNTRVVALPTTQKEHSTTWTIDAEKLIAWLQHLNWSTGAGIVLVGSSSRFGRP